MRKRPWIDIEWEPASESFMLDLFFETAPPEHQNVYLGLGRQEAMELRTALDKALKKRVKRTQQDDKA